MSAREGGEEGKWDQESVPYIREGFIDGRADFSKDHPCRSVIRTMMTPGILSLLIFMDSFD